MTTTQADAGACPAGAGLHARPGNREAVDLQPELGHELEVVAPAVIVIAGDIAGRAVRDGSEHAGEAVPDRLAAPAIGDAASI